LWHPPLRTSQWVHYFVCEKWNVDPLCEKSDCALRVIYRLHSIFLTNEPSFEVFDFKLLRYPNIEEEMVAMLQIGTSYFMRMLAQRPKMVDVVKVVEDIRSVNTGNRPSNETKSSGSTPNLTPSGA
ncbi:Hypothetical predicted protein, partial [Olea europaea subsp. europaea]